MTDILIEGGEALVGSDLVDTSVHVADERIAGNILAQRTASLRLNSDG